MAHMLAKRGPLEYVLNLKCPENDAVAQRARRFANRFPGRSNRRLSELSLKSEEILSALLKSCDIFPSRNYLRPMLQLRFC